MLKQRHPKSVGLVQTCPYCSSEVTLYLTKKQLKNILSKFKYSVETATRLADLEKLKELNSNAEL